MPRVTHLNAMHRGADGGALNADDIPFTPNGSISSTDVQAAIQEVRDEATGGSGPFQDVDTITWKFTSPATDIASTDQSAYLTLDTDTATLRGGTANEIDVTSTTGKIGLFSDYGVVLPVESTEPGGGDSEDGQVYYNSSTGRFRAYLDGAWVDLVRGALASITGAAAIANTETVVASFLAPADMMEVGTTFRIKAFGRLTSGATGGSSIFRCRIGSTTLTGNIPATLTITNANNATAAPFQVEMLVTVRTNGGTGSAIGNAEVTGGTTAAFTVAGNISAISATVTVDTTADKYVEFTYISGNAGTTATFENAVIELLG
jgi:hypothetical protein